MELDRTSGNKDGSVEGDHVEFTPPEAAEVATDRVVPRFNGSLLRYPPSEEEAQAGLKAEAMGWIARAAGFDELRYAYLWKSVMIELVGMVFFTAVSIAAVLSTFGQQPGPSQAPLINPPALGVGVFHFFLLSLFIFCFAASSGAHFNPLISWATMLTGHTPVARALLYTVAQTCGATIGAALIKSALPDATIKWTENTYGQGELAGCAANDRSFGEVVCIEFIFSMVLLFAAYGTAFNARQGEVFGPILAPLIIGATLGITIYSSGTLISQGYSGAGMNPARCFGPAVVTGGDNLDRLGAYWLGPFLAAAVHAVIYTVAPPHHKDLYIEEATRAAAKKNQ